MGVPSSAKKAHLSLWIITGIFWTSYAVIRILYGGNCQRPELQADFDSERYVGVWYEIFRDTTVQFEVDDCTTARYEVLPYNYIEVNNLEFSISEQENISGIPAPGKAQCSSFRSGLCQVKFFELTPWSDYSIMSTDYTSHTVVYGCDNFAAGMVRADWLWALTRSPLEIGTSDHDTMKDTVFDIIDEKLEGKYDTSERLYYTKQSANSGCIYNGI